MALDTVVDKVHADELIAAYVARTPRSGAAYERFRKVLPGGDTRSVTYYPPYPVVVVRGEGARILDLDGNEYVDVLNNYTSLVHGHAAPAIVDAVETALKAGSAHGAPTEHLLALAELIVSRYPAAQLVRFTNSGTEAAMLALRLARHATGRRRFVMFEGGYHGTSPEFADPGPEVVRVPYNDVGALRAAVDESIAAVFAEPFLGSGGVVPATDGFLREVEQTAHSARALFVLDEVQSLRTAYAGVHTLLGLQPDLILMGKIIGGGFPVGALGGSTQLMGLTAADRPGGLKHSGTFNGNPVTTAAGLASMKLLDAPAIELLNQRADLLANRIEASGRARNLPVVVTRHGSIVQVHFSKSAPTAAAAVQREPASAVAALHTSLLLHGVFAAPRGMLNMSTALTDSDLNRVSAAYDSALADVARVLGLA
jgi:glutamate-1-semialdehyde 2,1-aminomutase